MRSCNRRLLGLLVTSTIFVSACSTQQRAPDQAGVSAPAGKRELLPYADVGRIEWQFPSGFEYYVAVPHFTVGPRIVCAGKLHECEIQVASRDIRKRSEQRRDELVARLKPYAARSIERQIEPRSSGTAPELTFVTLTDSRPKPGEFRIMTIGYAVNGTAVIQFRHATNDAGDTEAMLQIIRRARTLDALPVWAWRLSDYKAACAERFPEFSSANDAAFAASPFAAVDVIGFWRSTVPEESDAAARQKLQAARDGYAKAFDSQPLQARSDFCRNFPTWVKMAAADLPAK
jgi:hypothetical protein